MIRLLTLTFAGMLMSPTIATAATMADTTPAKTERHPKAFLNERRQHWAYQPVANPPPPEVKNLSWCSSTIDRFILAKLEANGFSPAAPADRRTLIRRATFDLTGLPPTPAEVEEFVRDISPDAFAKVVERLLASPHYGERWARHWLDLVRFSETLGFEFDFDLYNSWRYRDYVIRAFNTDLPYDQFVIEQLAGDLVESPRRDPIEKFNESILATGFFWMGEGRQTPVDIRQEQADIIDSQIDVLGKAFLAQTIACARCHDHKFDAISTQDYYALAGYLKSSRYQQAFIDAPEELAEKTQRLARLKSEIRALVADQTAIGWIEHAAHASRYLLAARQAMSASSPDAALIKETSEQFGLEAARLERWVAALQQPGLNSSDHPLYAWMQFSGKPASAKDSFAQRRESILSDLRRHEQQAVRTGSSAKLFDNFFRQNFDDWRPTGMAFGKAPAQAGDIILGEQSGRPVAQFTFNGAHSGLLSTKLQGELRSETFTITKPYLHYQMSGQRARLNLIIDGYTLIMNPMYGGLTAIATNDQLAWRTMAVDRWIGHRAFIEISDSTVPAHRLNPPPSNARVPENPSDAYITVNQIYFSDDRTPPAAFPNRFNLEALGDRTPDAETLAGHYQELIIRELERWKSGRTADAGADAVTLLNWLLQNGLLDGPPLVGAEKHASNENEIPAAAEPSERLTRLLAQYRALEATLPSPRRTPALADGTGEDEFVFVRGNYKTLGEKVARRLPEVFPRAQAESSSSGSGRLALARRLVDPSNPLPARVMVNRIWQHHFGEGIVRTPDDFGRMGQMPTHPELLDYLATQFVGRGWSIKEMHRFIMLSSAYQMSSRPLGDQLERDPENHFLHYMPVRRLEAEAIRDAILAVSGELNPATHGPSVLPYLTPYMEGRGRPNSGPLDGDGRRSIYINARRNFPMPMLVAFDYPVHFSTNGRREVSAVPEQAMTLMNDPFVVQQAGKWAARVLAETKKTAEERINALYQTAFARNPTDLERRAAIDFLANQARQHGAALDDSKTWADLCHVLFNVKEFIFIN